MKLFLLLKGSQDLFDDGCASPRFESSIYKQIKKYTHEGCISLSGASVHNGFD